MKTLVWALARGVTPIPRATGDHVGKNLRAVDADVPDVALDAVDALERGERLLGPDDRTEPVRWQLTRRFAFLKPAQTASNRARSSASARSTSASSGSSRYVTHWSMKPDRPSIRTTS